MDRFPLIVDRKETTLSIETGQLRIETPEQKHSVPLHLVDLVIIAVNTFLNTSALQKLAQQNIPTVILPSRGRGEVAWVTPGLSTSWSIRQKQYPNIGNAEIAWTIVERKLKAQQKTLTILQLPLGPLEQIQPPNDITLDKVLGQEGAGARYYFEQLMSVIPPEWSFHGRSRRPPQDPFNALLSLTYTLFTTEALNAIQTQGFDPWVGFLHQPYPARPSLALDLIEPLRPQIDLWCLGLTQGGLDPHDHFDKTENGVLLNKEGRNIYFAMWAQDRQNWYNEKSVPQLLRQEAIALKELLESYQIAP